MSGLLSRHRVRADGRSFRDGRVYLFERFAGLDLAAIGQVLLTISSRTRIRTRDRTLIRGPVRATNDEERTNGDQGRDKNLHFHKIKDSPASGLIQIKLSLLGNKSVTR